MKPLTIEGVAVVDVTADSGIALVRMGGIDLSTMVARKMSEGGGTETSLCEIAITIKPFRHSMTINGETMPVEL
jgi:hypothetical protein